MHQRSQEAAIDKELSRLREKLVGNESKVPELRGIERGPEVKDALFDRIFGILGVKRAEIGAELQKRKAWIVLQSGLRPH